MITSSVVNTLSGKTTSHNMTFNSRINNYLYNDQAYTQSKQYLIEFSVNADYNKLKFRFQIGYRWNNRQANLNSVCYVGRIIKVK